LRARRLAGSTPAPLVQAREQFERWRSTRSQRTIPDGLWHAAVRLAGEYGIGRTSRALRLDYYSLKRRVESTEGRRMPAAPVFVDAIPKATVDLGEGVAEFEDASGARIRIEWKGGGAPDLTALTRSFFGGAA
jgi:hypothetical protein